MAGYQNSPGYRSPAFENAQYNYRASQGQVSGPVNPASGYKQYTPPRPAVLGASTSGNNAAVPSTSAQPQYNEIQNQQDAINQQLEADYNQAMSALSGQEQGLQAQAGTATGQISADLGAAKNQLTSNQTQQQQGVSTSLQTAEKQGKSAMQQARDVFRQTQQANSAQLSALGISSSSVSEALAERLGVDVARRIAGVTGSLDEVRQNASTELNRINQYYTGKLEDATKQADLQKSQIQQSLVQGLNQINSARQAAASDKAARRASLLSQTQQAVIQLTQQQQQFQQSLQQWAAQKAASLQPIVQDPNYVQNLINQTQNLNSQFSSTGFVATPSFNVNEKGKYTGQINFDKKPLIDEFGNPINSKEDPLAQYLNGG